MSVALKRRFDIASPHRALLTIKRVHDHTDAIVRHARRVRSPIIRVPPRPGAALVSGAASALGAVWQ